MADIIKLISRKISVNNKVKDFFNDVAKTYVHEENEIMDKLLNSLNLSDYKRILDLGAGKGIISNKLQMLSNDGEVIGLDISEKMIEFAMANNTNEKVKFVLGDFYEYNPQEKFDAIVCFDAFPHFLDVDLFNKKNFELLNEGGMLAIIHDIGRDQLNTHHMQNALRVSRPLEPPLKEAEKFINRFQIIEADEGDNYYKLILKK